MSLNLRPYQLAAVANTRAAVLAGSKAPLIVSPTGSGKTILGAHMLESCVGLGGNASFLTGRMELTDQTSRKLDEAHLDHGVIQADHWRWRPHLPVQVASIHTLHKRGYRPQASLVIADEAHTALSPSYRGLLDAYRADGATVVGLTATPYPPNGSMSDFFDSLTVVAQVDELIRAGYLVPIEVYAPNDPAVANVRIKGGDFDPTELEAAVNKPAIVGDIVQTWKRLAAGRTTAVFAVSKKHARGLQAEFIDQGIPCEYLDDETPGPQRRAVQERIASGESPTVVNVGILCLDSQTELLSTEGWIGMDAIDETTRVASWWPNGSVSFDPPKAIHKRKRMPGERMVSVYGERTSIRVTEGHELLYRHTSTSEFRKKAARLLVGKTFRFPVSGRADPLSIQVPQPRGLSSVQVSRLVARTAYNVRQSSGIDSAASLIEARTRVARKYGLKYKQPSELTTAECALIGFWIGDGSLTKNKRAGGSAYTLAQSTVYPKIIRWIDRLVRATGYDSNRRIVTPRVGNPSITWRLSRGTGGGVQQREGIFAIEPYLNKHGSHLLWGLSERQFDALLLGLWRADGEHGDGFSLPATHQMRIGGVDKGLFDLLQAIATVRGYRAAIRKSVNNVKQGYRPLFTLTIKKTAEFFIGTDRLEMESDWKDEDVWCVTSESGAIITRREGRVTVMGNCIGWDMPRVSCVVMARHTLSRALYRQMVGRGTRPWCVICGGTSRSCISPLHKPNLIVLDHVGNVYRHGLPDEPEEFSLNMNGRLKATDRAKGLRKCLNPGCYGKTSPAGSKSCIHCGLPFPARERSLVFRDGTLESFGSSVEGPARRQVTSDPAERARLLAKWTARAALAHNKLGQASVVYKSTFGCWPEPEIVAASVLVPWPRYLVANGRCRHCQSTAVHTVPAPPHAAQVVCSACARGLAWVDDEFAPLVATSPTPTTTDLFAAGVA